MGSKSWPVEDDQVVRDLWGFHSAAVIARSFLQGRYSRNSVIGRANRMGLKDALKTTDPLAPPPKARVMTKPKPKLAVVPPIPEPDPRLIDGKHIALLELSRGMCKWPISHMSEPEVYFCGLADDGKSPYCIFHHGRSIDRSRQPKSAEEVNRSSQGANRVFR